MPGVSSSWVQVLWAGHPEPLDPLHVQAPCQDPADAVPAGLPGVSQQDRQDLTVR